MSSSVIDQIKELCPDIIDLESASYARIPEHIQHESVFVENALDNDIEILVNLLHDTVYKELQEENEANPNLPNRAVMIFCENKTKMNRICDELQDAGIMNLPFNDNTKQLSLKQRYRTLNYLNEGKVPVLVSDNFGSRGLDTMNVSHVIQFDYAKTAEDYL